MPQCLIMQLQMPLCLTMDTHMLHCPAVYPDSKVHGANMGPTWVLSAPSEPHVGPMNLAIRVVADTSTDVSVSMYTATYASVSNYAAADG